MQTLVTEAPPLTGKRSHTLPELPIIGPIGLVSDSDAAKADGFTRPPHVRSRMMSGIRGKDTRPELLIRKALHAAGFCYRLHDRRLAGTPDLVLAGRKAVIFVHGCFWHGHDCHLFRVPSTRTEFWLEKIAANRERDRRDIGNLTDAGWRIATVWECSLKGRTRRPLGEVTGQLGAWLAGNDPRIEIDGRVP